VVRKLPPFRPLVAGQKVRRCAECKGYGEITPMDRVNGKLYVAKDADGNELPPKPCPRCHGTGLDPLRSVQ
jgi:DnaJ-class molecular chaperone